MEERYGVSPYYSNLQKCHIALMKPTRRTICVTNLRGVDTTATEMHCRREIEIRDVVRQIFRQKRRRKSLFEDLELICLLESFILGFLDEVS